MVAMWVALAANTGIIQFVHHDRYYQTAQSQSTKKVTLKAERGGIQDRNGTSLAITLGSASYGVWPRKVSDPDNYARVLAPVLRLSEDEVRAIFQSKKKYQYLIRHADIETMRRIDAVLDSLDDPMRVKVKAFEKIPEFKRCYPLGRIGAQVVGYTDVDNHGIEGLELFFDRELAGNDGRSVLLRDAMLRSDRFLAEPVVEARDGLDMRLTIDWRIQEIAEEELEAGVEKAQAKYGGVIVLDAGTGEILSMANVPRFDPNDPASFNSLDPIYRKNRLVTDMMEPGSTFKIVTFAEALETGVVKESDMIDCMGGNYRIGSHTIHDSHELGVVPAEDVLVFSSNIGTVRIAERFGKRRLYERARMFGFGEVTGSDFPNETRGMLPNPKTWSNLSLPTISFGQGVAVSPLQLVAAYGAIANGGELLSPRIISGFRDRGGNIVRASGARTVRRVMERETAERLSNILCGVVERGTGKSAAIPGIRIAGKTGTAQRIQEGSKGYAGGKYISSFIGFIADRDPKLVCLVLVDSPVGVYYGSQVAAPVFKNIMNRILNMGESPLSRMLANDSSAPECTVKVPSLRNVPSAQAIEQLRALGFVPKVVGDPATVVKQFPQEGTPLKRGSGVTLYTNSFTTARGDSVPVPDLAGKSLREAVQDLVQANLKVKVVGSGVVGNQSPLPGTLVAYGTICEIECRKR